MAGTDTEEVDRNAEGRSVAPPDEATTPVAVVAASYVQLTILAAGARASSEDYERFVSRGGAGIGSIEETDHLMAQLGTYADLARKVLTASCGTLLAVIDRQADSKDEGVKLILDEVARMVASHEGCTCPTHIDFRRIFDQEVIASVEETQEAQLETERRLG